MSFYGERDEDQYLYGIQGETVYNEFQLQPRSPVAYIDFERAEFKNFHPSVSLNLPGQKLSSLSVVNDGPSAIRFSVVRYENSSQADIYVKGGGESPTIRTHGKQIKRINIVWAGTAGSTSGANVRIIGMI